MPPSIRYGTTTDGVRIAFATLELGPGLGLGTGVPLLCLPPFPFSHLDAGWRVDGQRRWYEELSRHVEVALYDSRGTGLSERGPQDFRLEAMTLDLEAIVKQLGWEQFALCGLFNSTPLAIQYAARHPEQVTDLVLWGPFARGADVYPVGLPAEAPDLVMVYWQMLITTAAQTWTSGAKEAKEVADFFGACVEPATALQAFAAAREYDVDEDVEAVSQRTLVLHRPGARSQRPDLAPALASRMPKAELALLEGDAASPFVGDIDAAIETIARFLGVAPAPRTVLLPADEREGARDRANGGDGGFGLTARETEVLRLLARGSSNKQIARDLGLSVHTVERHLTNLYPKIGCRSRTEATAFALTHRFS